MLVTSVKFSFLARCKYLKDYFFILVFFCRNLFSQWPACFQFYLFWINVSSKVLFVFVKEHKERQREK